MGVRGLNSDDVKITLLFVFSSGWHHPFVCVGHWGHVECTKFHQIFYPLFVLPSTWNADILICENMSNLRILWFWVFGPAKTTEEIICSKSLLWSLWNKKKLPDKILKHISVGRRLSRTSRQALFQDIGKDTVGKNETNIKRQIVKK